MARLSRMQRQFLFLVARSANGTEWATVSKVMWGWTVTMQEELPELLEIDEDNQRVRLTEKGDAVVRYSRSRVE